MSQRFIIDCYGIIDTYKSNTGVCEDDVLSWRELCDTLNELDEWCNENLDEYEYIVKLKNKNKLLNEKLQEYETVLDKIKQIEI